MSQSQTSCCVPGCLTSQDVRLHHFPNPETDIEKFRTWVLRIGGHIIGLENNYIFKNRRICSRHFEPVYIYSRRLSKTAIPTLNLGSHFARVQTRVEQVSSVHHEDWAIPGTSQQNPSGAHMYESGLPARVAVEPVPMEVQSAVPSIPFEKSHTYVTRVQLTKEEMELQKVVWKTERKLQRSEESSKSLRKKLVLMKKVLKTEACENVTKHMSPAAKDFFAMQVKQSHKLPRGRRFTLDEKILCLTLYKPSPRAYRILGQICPLPGKKTLDKLINKLTLKTGINNTLFEHLRQKVLKMPNSHKYCTVIFDEMAISAQLTYSLRDDNIQGFCDDGMERNLQIADHVLVFMIRGVIKKCKQPIAYSFCAGSSKTYSLKKQIGQVIENVQKTGLKVIATVCDQGTTNIAAINSLIDETKRHYLRRGEDWVGGFFEVNEEKIYPIFDPPHLIKGIRNNLLTKNLEFSIQGKPKTAKWSHLQALYKRGPSYKGARLIPKLTECHVTPSLIPKMRVKNATQVFSRSVAVALGFMADIGKLPKACRDTADLIMLLDQLFDSVNGSFHKPKDKKIYRSAVTPKSPHRKLWQKCILVFQSMNFIFKSGRKGSVPSIDSWVKTIKAFQAITDLLFREGLTSLLLRHFNQDPLENFFGAIRAHGIRNTMPGASSFIASYKTLLLNNIASHNAIGSNCEEDDAICLGSVKEYIYKEIDKKGDENTVHNEIYPEHYLIDLVDLEKLLQSNDYNDKEKCAAAAYCCGWLLNQCKKKIIKNCPQCNNNLEGTEEHFHKYITMKKYSEKSILHYPTKDFLNFFIQVENIVDIILQSHAHLSNIFMYIELIVTVILNFDFIKCAEHKKALINFLLKRTITFFIRNYIKEINSLLSGQTSQYNTGDTLKDAAHKYYVRHKHYKK